MIYFRDPRSFAGTYAFVTSQGVNSISVINTQQQREILKMEIGEFPQGVIVGPEGRFAYVANWFSNEEETAMYIKSVPEDSVLLRHFESAAAMKRSAWLRRPPSDSILSRHFSQLRESRLTQPAAHESRSAPARMTQSPAPNAADGGQTDDGGFFGWLRRLFSG